MASVNRCPDCRAQVHPTAALCHACGADMDAHRRRLRQGGSHRARLGLRLPAPSAGLDLTDLVVLTLIMLVLALFVPLYGAVFSLFMVWHSHHNSLVARRNAAAACAALALFNLLAPGVIELRIL